MMKLKVGIFWGGPSRERGRSFAKARSVFQSLDQRLFEPLLFFVDIHLKLYQCNTSMLYQESLKDLFGKSTDDFTIYQERLQFVNEAQQQEIYGKIGQLVQLDQLPQLINIAFVETWADLGAESWLLAYLIENRIPYIGPAAEVRQLRSKKSVYLSAIQEAEISCFKFKTLDQSTWYTKESEILTDIQQECDFPLQVSPDQQHDMFADALIKADTLRADLKEAIDRAFFQEEIPVASWRSRGYFDRRDHIRYLTHLRDGLGFPVKLYSPLGESLVQRPEDLLTILEEHTTEIADDQAIFRLVSQLPADSVLIKSIPAGTPFEVLLLEDAAGQPIALYPQTPELENANKIGLTQLQLDQIRSKAAQFYTKMNLGPLVLLKGVYTAKDQVLFDVPDISCALEDIGTLLKHWTVYNLDSHQLLMYLIIASLQKRYREHPEQKTNQALIAHLNELRTNQLTSSEYPTVSVVLAGSGRQLPQANSAARFYWEVMDGLTPFPVHIYRYKDETNQLQEIEPATLLSDSAYGKEWTQSPLYWEVSTALKSTLLPFDIDLHTKNSPLPFEDLQTGFVYPILTGVFRDGRVQQTLEKYNIPYNGSNSKTLAVVYENESMLQALARNGCQVKQQFEVTRVMFSTNLSGLIQELEAQLVYPMWVYPGDADLTLLRQKVNKREELMAYAQLLFRPKGSLASSARQILRIKDAEEIPTKDAFLVETVPDQSWTPLLSSLFCHRKEDGETTYEIIGHSILDEGEITTPASKLLLALQKPAIQYKLAQELERFARLLNLQSFVTIESYLRIFADDSIQVVLTQVDALPLLNADHPLLAHAMLAGRNPAEVFQTMFADHLKQPLQKITSEPTMVNQEDEHQEIEQPRSNDPEPIPVPRRTEKEDSAFKKMLKAIRAFLVSPIFWKNVGGIVVMALLLFGLTLFLLARYTHHGSSYVVEDYIDMSFEDAKRKARGKTLRAVVIDSIFIIGEAPNIVKDQDPKPGSKVKKRRTVYMWVTGGQAPEILLPNLAGKDDFETYRRELERRNIRLIIKERKFDRKLQENTLLGFYYRGEKISTETVNDGFKVVEGSTLEAIVSKRTSDELPIPNLVCETFEDAKFKIQSSRLVLGEVYGTRSNDAYVWKQEPAFEPGVTIKTGTVIKLHLTSARPADCQ